MGSQTPAFTEQIKNMKILLVLAVAALTKADPDADPAFSYSTGLVPQVLAFPQPLASAAPLPLAAVHHFPYSVPLTYTLAAGGCQNAQGSIVPCNLGGVAVAAVAPSALSENVLEVSKREAGPEPTAEADPDADPWYYYSSYGHPYSYSSYSYAPHAYGYYGGYYPYSGYGYGGYGGYGYHGRKKREAEATAEAEADPEADPWYYYSGYSPYSYGYAAPYSYGAYYHAPLTYLLGGCRNYLGSLVPCAGK